MNAQALQAPEIYPLAEARAEHISLETSPDLAAIPVPPPRRVCATFTLRSALRGCSTEVAILEDHYLRVRRERSRTPPCTYVFDLRFLNPKPERVRHLAWAWFVAGGISAMLTIGAAWWAIVSATSWMHPAIAVAVSAAIATAIASYLSARRTSESLEFVSTHGGAPLVSILGGIGSAQAGKSFFIELIKSITAAKAARPQSPQHFLRDEMREHYRLYHLDVMTEAEYEQGKGRILRAHGQK